MAECPLRGHPISTIRLAKKQYWIGPVLYGTALGARDSHWNSAKEVKFFRESSGRVPESEDMLWPENVFLADLYYDIESNIYKMENDMQENVISSLQQFLLSENTRIQAEPAELAIASSVMAKSLLLRRVSESITKAWLSLDASCKHRSETLS